MSVTGKVILINGATRGLGFEYARSLAALGAKIVGSDVMDCDLLGAMPVKLDVTDPAKPGDDGERAWVSLKGSWYQSLFDQVHMGRQRSSVKGRPSGFRLICVHLCSSVVPFFLEPGYADTEEMKPQMNPDTIPGIS